MAVLPRRASPGLSLPDKRAEIEQFIDHARAMGRGDPRSMCPRLVHDTQVLCPIVGCGLRVEIDSVHCCLLLICWLLLRVELVRCDAATHVRRGTTPRQSPSVRILGVFAGHTP
jgi:hypothetical protein